MWLDIVGEHVWQSLGLEQHGSATIPVSAGVVICLSCMPILYRFGQLSRNMYIKILLDYMSLNWVELLWVRANEGTRMELFHGEWAIHVMYSISGFWWCSWCSWIAKVDESWMMQSEAYGYLLSDKYKYPYCRAAMFLHFLQTYLYPPIWDDKIDSESGCSVKLKAPAWACCWSLVPRRGSRVLPSVSAFHGSISWKHPQYWWYWMKCEQHFRPHSFEIVCSLQAVNRSRWCIAISKLVLI